MLSGTVECAPFERAEKVCFVAQFQFETMFDGIDGLWDCSSDFGCGMCLLLFVYLHIRTHIISGNYQEGEVVCLGLDCFVFGKERKCGV